MPNKKKVLATEAAPSDELLLKLTLELVRATLDAEEFLSFTK